MASLGDDLKQAVALSLQTSESFTLAKGIAISFEPRDPPCIWIGATGPDQNADKPSYLLTVHVWLNGSKDRVALVTHAVGEALRAAPIIEGHPVKSWTQSYSEVRHHEEDTAHRGMVRFRAEF